MSEPSALSQPAARVRVRSIAMEDPWNWMAAGWRDLMAQPGPSLGYGAVFVIGGLIITAGLWRLGLSAATPAAAGAFALVAPLFAIQLYRASRRRDTSEAAQDRVGSGVASAGQLAFVAFLLVFLFLAWARIAQLLFALFISGDYPPLNEFTAYALTNRDGLMLFAIGSVAGGLLAFLAFAVSAVSLPLLVDRNIDAVTAIATSFEAIRVNPGPMVLWAWIIAVTIAVGIATAFIGLIVAFPLLAHATWHAYRDLVEVLPPDPDADKPAAPKPPPVPDTPLPA